MPLSRNLGTLTSWNPLGHSRPVTGLIYLLLIVQIAIAQSRYEAFCFTVTIFWGVSPFDIPVPTFRSNMLPPSLGWKVPGHFVFADSSETLVPVHQITRCHIPQYRSLNTRRSKSHLASLHTRHNLICVLLNQLQFVVHSSDRLQPQPTRDTWLHTQTLVMT